MRVRDPGNCSDCFENGCGGLHSVPVSKDHFTTHLPHPPPAFIILFHRLAGFTYVAAKRLCRQFFFSARRRVACPECIEGPHAQNGQGTPRPYPTTFCVFCGVSVSSVVSPTYPKNARAFVGANGRSPLPTVQPSVFSVALLCFLWFPRTAPKSCGGFAGARHRAPKAGEAAPRPYPTPFCVFGGLSVCFL